MTNDFITRARMVSNIFNILAWVILVVGAVITLFSVIAALTSDDVLIGLMFSAGVAASTAVYWAGVQLGSLVAGYIAQRV
jgi:hypothetical protein